MKTVPHVASLTRGKRTQRLPGAAFGNELRDAIPDANHLNNEIHLAWLIEEQRPKVADLRQCLPSITARKVRLLNRRQSYGVLATVKYMQGGYWHWPVGDIVRLDLPRDRVVQWKLSAPEVHRMWRMSVKDWIAAQALFVLTQRRRSDHGWLEEVISQGEFEDHSMISYTAERWREIAASTVMPQPAQLDAYMAQFDVRSAI